MDYKTYSHIFDTYTDTKDIIAEFDLLHIDDWDAVYKFDACKKQYGCELFKYFYSKCQNMNINDYFNYAVEDGNIELVEYLCNTHNITTEKLSANDWNILDYALNCYDTLDMLKYLNKKFNIGKPSFTIAEILRYHILYLDLDVFIYMIETYNIDYYVLIHYGFFIEDCCSCGNLQILTYICNRNVISMDMILYGTGSVNFENDYQLECAKYLWERYDIQNDMYRNGCENGYLVLVKYMLEQNAIDDVDICDI